MAPATPAEIEAREARRDAADACAAGVAAEAAAADAAHRDAWFTAGAIVGLIGALGIIRVTFA